MRSELRTRPAWLRWRAGLGLLAALFAFLSASMRAPLLALPCVPIASVVDTADAGERAEVVASSSELHRAPAVRSGKAPNTAGSGAALRSVAPGVVLASASGSIEAPHTTRSWAPAAKTHDELMVFLN